MPGPPNSSTAAMIEWVHSLVLSHYSPYYPLSGYAAQTSGSQGNFILGETTDAAGFQYTTGGANPGDPFPFTGEPTPQLGYLNHAGTSEIFNQVPIHPSDFALVSADCPELPGVPQMNDRERFEAKVRPRRQRPPFFPKRPSAETRRRCCMYMSKSHPSLQGPLLPHEQTLSYLKQLFGAAVTDFDTSSYWNMINDDRPEWRPMCLLVIWGSEHKALTTKGIFQALIKAISYCRNHADEANGRPKGWAASVAAVLSKECIFTQKDLEGGPKSASFDELMLSVMRSDALGAGWECS